MISEIIKIVVFFSDGKSIIYGERLFISFF